MSFKVVNANQAKAFEDKAFEQVWYELQRRINAAFGSAVVIEGCCFVGPDGNDATAQPDSLVSKYATPQAAVNAALASGPRAVVLCPGIYTTGVVLPATFTTLVMIGLIPRSATIYPSAADTPAIQWVGGAGGFNQVYVDGVNLAGNVAAGPSGVVVFDATAVSTDGRVTLADCTIQNDDPNQPCFLGVRLNGMTATGCKLEPGASGAPVVVLSQCSRGEFEECTFSQQGLFADIYDATGVEPPGFRTTTLLTRCRVGNVVVGNEAVVNADYSVFDGNVVANITDNNGGRGQFNPSYCELVNVQYVCDLQAGDGQVGTGAFNKFNQGLSCTQATGGNLAMVQMRNSNQFGANVAAGADTFIDILGSLFLQPNLIGPGAINRDYHSWVGTQITVNPVGGAGGNTAFVIDPPFRNLSYDVIWNGGSAAPEGTIVEYVAKQDTGFTTSSISPNAVAPVQKFGDLRTVARIY